MASKDSCCSICELQHKTKDAEVYCPECEENLCSTCKTHHALANATRKHKTLTLSDVMNLPAYVHEIRSVCDEHNEKLEYFCSKHDTPFCVLCTESHKDCGKFTLIRDIQGVKSSSSMTILEENIEDIQQALKNLADDRKMNLQNLADQKHHCHLKVKEIRLKINNHLDMLEAAITKEIDDIYTKNKSDLRDFLNNVMVSKEKIIKMQNDVGRIKQHATEIQTFLSSRKITQDVLQEEEKVKRMYDEKHVEILELSILPKKNVETGNILQSFGQVHLKRKGGSITWKSKTNIQGQIMTPSSSVDINALKSTKRLYVDLKMYIYINVKTKGCINTPDGRILLCDQSKNRIINLKSSGHHNSNIKLSFKPFEIVYAVGNIFVTSFKDKRVACIDIETSLVKKEVKLETPCCGIALVEDQILVHLSNLEFKIFDQNLNEVGSIPIRIQYAPNIAYKGGRLYMCQWNENTMYCYNMKGELQWKFKNPKLIRPNGVTNDDNGNIYVCGYISHNIMVISPDGDKYRILVDDNEPMRHPTSLYFNNNTKRLLVTSYISQVLMEFDITER